MTLVHQVSVFTDPLGRYGDKATIIFDEQGNISLDRRIEMAAQLDAVETAFVDDETNSTVSFVHEQGEIDFAGVPAVGVAWLLSQRSGQPIRLLRGRAADIEVVVEGGVTWVRTDLSTMPGWGFREFETPEEIEAIDVVTTSGWPPTMAWAWRSEKDGTIRARTFAAEWGIPEAQGNGSGSMLLAASLGRQIEVLHGDGSVIYARAAADGTADIGGRVTVHDAVTI